VVKSASGDGEQAAAEVAVEVAEAAMEAAVAETVSNGSKQVVMAVNRWQQW
jgi:hypothetical protein